VAEKKRKTAVDDKKKRGYAALLGCVE